MANNMRIYTRTDVDNAFKEYEVKMKMWRRNRKLQTILHKKTPQEKSPGVIIIDSLGSLIGNYYDGKDV